jgi:hypothetical protein
MSAFVMTENLQLHSRSTVLGLGGSALHRNHSTGFTWISILFLASHRQRIQVLPVAKSASQPFVLTLSKINTDFIKTIEENITKLLRWTFPQLIR